MIMEEDSSKHFSSFLGSLKEKDLVSKTGNEKELYERQKKQIESLYSLEKDFRRTLIRHPWGAASYRDFITHIRDEKRNILDARPYFRVRHKVFTAKISPALKSRNFRAMFRFDFNYRFVTFVLGLRKWPKNSKLRKIAAEIESIRWGLVQDNLPLAINRARIFWSRTPHSHLSFMDEIQICCEGLLCGVDKFVLPYSKGFRGVAIGRMVGYLISNYSQTTLHFFPSDKKKIYRANKCLAKDADIAPDELADKVNNDFLGTTDATPDEISMLVSASSCMSYDYEIETPEGKVGVRDTISSSDKNRPDKECEDYLDRKSVDGAIKHLSLLERKFLTLMGVDSVL